MSFFKNLFNKKNDLELTNKEKPVLSKSRTLEDIVKSGELGLSGYLAHTCFMAIDMRPTDSSVSNSIFAIANGSGGLASAMYTEQYFYEEVAIAFLWIAEAEVSHGFIRFIIHQDAQANTEKTQISAHDVLFSMSSIAYQIARERMQIVGIEPNIKVDEFFPSFGKRLSEYGKFQEAALSCQEPLPQTAWQIGLEPRNHPYKTYLGEMSDNIARAVGIDMENTVGRTLIDLAVMNKYSFTMERVTELMRMLPQ